MGEFEQVSHSTYPVVPDARRSVHEKLMPQDEPRRSSRANKGNHNDRWAEVLESARHNFVSTESVAGDSFTDVGTVQTDGQNDTQQAAGEDEIRCVCGQTEEVDDEDKDFVQCDRCHVWQHTQCVGLPADVSEDQEYFCDRCRPDLHQPLLKEISNGKFAHAKSKPKGKAGKKRKRQNNKVVREESPLQSDNFDESKADNKRQRSSSVSDLSVMSEESEYSHHDRQNTDSVNLPTTNTTSRSQRAAGQRRNAYAKTARVKSTSSKKSSSTAKSLKEPFTDVDEIEDQERRKIATALIRLLSDTLTLAMDNEGFVLPEDQPSVEEEAKYLGLQIEFAMYNAQLDGKAKFRQLSFNLRDPKNPALRERVLNRSLQPAELVQMSSEDMANPELKAKTEALREESLKQSVLVQETGPRIRRTHKGEEYVEGPDAVVEHVSSTSPLARPRNQHPSDSPASSMSPNSPFQDRAGSPRSPPSPPAVPTRERSDSSFNISSVWSHIEPSHSESPAPLSSRSPRQVSTSRPTDNDNDEDLLGLLEGDEKNVQQYNYATSGPVWRGQVVLPTHVSLQVSLSLLGGPKTFDIAWDPMLGESLCITTRMATERATNYLCKMRWSTTKNLLALRIQAGPGEEAAWHELYNYLMSRDRCGVIESRKSRMRDGYIVPLSLGAALPPYLVTLPSFNVPADRGDMLIAVIVVERDYEEPSQPAPAVVKAEPSPPPQLISQASNASNPVAYGFAPAVTAYWQEPAIQDQRRDVPPSPYAPPTTASYAQPPQPLPFEDPYMRRAQMTMQQSMPPQLDHNAQEVLIAFLRAHPEIASNTQVISSPQLMARLLEEYVRNGGMRH